LIAVRTADVVLTESVPVMPFIVAEMLAEPMPVPVRRPAEFTDMVAAAELLQLAEEVMVCELPSLNEPMAASCTVVPSGREMLVGVRLIETSVADCTVMAAEPVTAPPDARTLAVPAVLAVTTPCVPAPLLTRAMDTFETLQFAEVVTVCWVPLLSAAMAMNCWV